MADVHVLYIVTAMVLGGLTLWVAIVRFTAKDAPDESPLVDGQTDDGPSKVLGARDVKTAGSSKADRTPSSFTDETTLTKRPVAIHDETPPPLEVSVPSERAVAIAGKTAPVVVLPAMRSRLDSHTEIRDGAGTPVPAAPSDTKPEGSATPGSTDDPPVSISGPPLLLVSAIGRSEPSSGPTEMSAIIDRHRLFILADGGGQRVQNELVSAVLVDAFAAAFEADSHEGFATDHALAPRQDRLRRAVLAADVVLKGRGKEGELDLARVGMLAAHFSPDNRHLYIATAGRDRAYRLRTHEVTQLNKPSLAAVSADDARTLDLFASETAPDDVYVFGSDGAFLALGDELRQVLTFDPSIDRVAAHFVDAATRGGKSTGMTAIVVRVEPPRSSQRPTTI